MTQTPPDWEGGGFNLPVRGINLLWRRRRDLALKTEDGFGGQKVFSGNSVFYMFKSAAKVTPADIFILWAATAREAGRPGKPDERLRDFLNVCVQISPKLAISCVFAVHQQW